MSITSTDYTTVINQTRDCIAHGEPDKVDPVKVNRVIRDALTREAGIHSHLIAMNADIVAQFNILDAFTGADSAATIVAAIATASTLLRADGAVMAADAVTLGTDITVPTLSILDG